MKNNGLLEVEKNKTTKAIIQDPEERLFIRRCLKKLDASYSAGNQTKYTMH